MSGSRVDDGPLGPSNDLPKVIDGLIYIKYVVMDDPEGLIQGSPKGLPIRLAAQRLLLGPPITIRMGHVSR